MSERVHMVWDFYDGIRSGIADYEGKAHYFQCQFDKKNNNYSEFFDLRPIDTETLGFAQEQWTIFRAWELEYHSGVEQEQNHPASGGVNERYDELEIILKSRIENAPTKLTVRANFKQRNDKQTKRPIGCVADMDVNWY